MRLNPEEKVICKRYSAYDDMRVYCRDCSLFIDKRYCICLANIDSRLSEAKGKKEGYKMDGENPCKVCKRKNLVSGCGGCVLDQSSSGECYNDECFLHYECGCLLGLNDVCKASTCYEDDYRDHECGECVQFTEREDSDGEIYYTCGDGAQVGKWDVTCELFVEREK